MIQDNLIRFSSFLSQQDTHKTKALENAQIERAKIEEKDREIEQAQHKLDALRAQHDRIERKMRRLQKFEDLMKEVQLKYSDEFTDLVEITMRYDLLSKEHNRLKRKHDQSETAIDGINNQLDEFHKVTGTKSLEFTNLIAEE